MSKRGNSKVNPVPRNCEASKGFLSCVLFQHLQPAPNSEALKVISEISVLHFSMLKHKTSSESSLEYLIRF